MHTANTTTLLDEDRSLIDEVAETTVDEPDDLGDTLDALGKTDPTSHNNNNNNNPALGAAVQLLHVHDPVSSSSTLDAADDDDDEDDDEDRSETPTDGGQEEVDKKNDMVKVANVVQTVVPLTSYASASATPNGGGSAGVSAYTVTYDGGGSGHPGTTVYATGTPGLSTTTYQTAVGSSEDYVARESLLNTRCFFCCCFYSAGRCHLRGTIVAGLHISHGNGSGRNVRRVLCAGVRSAAAAARGKPLFDAGRVDLFGPGRCRLDRAASDRVHAECGSGRSVHRCATVPEPGHVLVRPVPGSSGRGSGRSSRPAFAVSH